MDHHLPRRADEAPRWSRRAFLRIAMGIPVLGASLAGGRVLYRWEAAAGPSTPAASPTPDCPATPTGGTPVASPAAAVTIKMTQDLRFDPPELVITVGQRVRWVNDSPLPHTATGDPEQNPVNTTHPEYVNQPEGAKPWGSELLQPSEEYEHTFSVPGRYDYICIPHVLSGMRASISVVC